MKRLILALCLAVLSATSCITLTLATMATSAIYELATRDTRLKGETVRKVNDKAALMKTRDGETVCIVYLFKGYRDGLRINAKFRQGGVYEYQDEAGVTRRAPIYVQSKHISELVETAVQLDIRYQEPEEKAPVYQI